MKELFQRRTDDVNSWQGHKAGARTGPSTCGACWIQENLNTCTVQCSTPGTENWGPKDKGHREWRQYTILETDILKHIGDIFFFLLRKAEPAQYTSANGSDFLSSSLQSIFYCNCLSKKTTGDFNTIDSKLQGLDLPWRNQPMSVVESPHVLLQYLSFMILQIQSQTIRTRWDTNAIPWPSWIVQAINIKYIVYFTYDI